MYWIPIMNILIKIFQYVDLNGNLFINISITYTYNYETLF